MKIKSSKSKIAAKVAAKIAKGKAKIAAKVKGKGACKGDDCDDGSCCPGGKCKPCAVALALILAATMCGCLDTAPASRATSANYRIDITLKVADGARGNTFNLPLTMGDGALASADSEGSTETQTITPTQTTDVKPDIDLNYNDPAKAAADGAQGVAESAVELIKSATAD